VRVTTGSPVYTIVRLAIQIGSVDLVISILPSFIVSAYPNCYSVNNATNMNACIHNNNNNNYYYYYYYNNTKFIKGHNAVRH